MRLGNREARSLVARRREAFRPKFQDLEERTLLSIDLGGVAPPTNPNVATVPYGIELAGGTNNGGAGFSVSDVGDLLNNGYDDFLISSPTITTSSGSLGLSSTGNSTVYLVFGSQAVNASTIQNWLDNTPDERVGDLLQLGLANQANPISGATGFPFAGITITASAQTNGQLGASVAAVGKLGGSSFNSFLIGAPGATDANGANPGTGRAYLIYGGPSLTTVPNNTLNLDNLTGSGVNVVTFVNSATGSATGRSVAEVGNVLGDGNLDIAIGAPTAGLTSTGNTGAVYLVNGSSLNSVQTSTINLANVGQTTNNVPGVIFSGASALSGAGFSVAGAGNTTGRVNSNNIGITDLLIGAPGTNGNTGAAYLVYGSTTLANLATTVNNVNLIQLSLVGNGVSGAVINGTAFGDQTGFSVASAGDFNQDGFSDILIGSPGFSSGAGQTTIIYGQGAGGVLTGSFSIAAIPSGISSTAFVGAAAGNLSGYSLTQVGAITNTSGTAPGFIAIGAPGFNNSAGTVYMIPYNVNLFGTFSLSVAEQQPIAGLQILLSATAGGPPTFLGASVSGRPNTPGKFTADTDTNGDLIVGAPGLGATSTRTLAGGAFILQGAFLPIQTPANTVISTQIGVGQAFGPFTVNPTTPAQLQIFVFSNANVSPVFNPATDIDPTTIVVNGVAFPNATVSPDPRDENNDGITDAIVTITPRSLLGLTSATTTFTIRGQTLASSPDPNQTFLGTTTISVSSTGGGGTINNGGVISFTNNVGFVQPTTFVPQYGPDTYVPPTYALSGFNYKAIPRAVAYKQFLPSSAWKERIRNYYSPKTATHRWRTPQNIVGVKVKFTLGNNVHTRTNGLTTGRTVTHKVPMIPTYRQTEFV